MEFGSEKEEQLKSKNYSTNKTSKDWKNKRTLQIYRNI